jgi:hypothetical protein
VVDLLHHRQLSILLLLVAVAVRGIREIPKVRVLVELADLGLLQVFQ